MVSDKERVSLNWPGFTVKRQLEAVRQKRLQHEPPFKAGFTFTELPKLVKSGAVNLRVQVIFFRVEPVWSSQNLRILNCIGRLNEPLERDVGCHEALGSKSDRAYREPGHRLASLVWLH